jgi:hypothetical protein
MTTTVWCTFQVAGFHNWPLAPEACSYLRAIHRHVFHVRVEAAVSHGNRDIEFIRFKHLAEEVFRGLSLPFPNGWMCTHAGIFLGARSCELLAQDLYHELKGNYLTITEITVSEDGENGATCRFDLPTA